MTSAPRILKIFPQSLRELASVRSLAILGMLVALSVAAEALTIPINTSLFIRFTFIFMSIAGYAFGPVSAGLAGAATDIIGFLLFPKGPFFPGYTLSAILGGVVYGFFLYKRDYTKRSFYVYIGLSKIVVNLFINLLLNTVWSSYFTGKGIFVLLPPRIIKNIALLPAEIIVMAVVLTFSARLLDRMKLNKNS